MKQFTRQYFQKHVNNLTDLLGRMINRNSDGLNIFKRISDESLPNLVLSFQIRGKRYHGKPRRRSIDDY